jgi:hypothetical protein
MPAKPIRPDDFAPPPPEIEHLFGGFAEFRAYIRAHRSPGVGGLTRGAGSVDLESLRRAIGNADFAEETGD